MNFQGRPNLASRLCSSQSSGFPSGSTPGRVFCSLQKVFSITAAAWLLVHCSSQQAYLQQRSYRLVPGFSSAVPGPSFHQLRRNGATILPSRKYSVSFTDVHMDLFKTFYHLMSGNFFYCWPDGHWVFHLCPLWKKGFLTQQLLQTFIAFLHNSVSESSPNGLEVAYILLPLFSFLPPSLQALCSYGWCFTSTHL